MSVRKALFFALSKFLKNIEFSYQKSIINIFIIDLIFEIVAKWLTSRSATPRALIGVSSNLTYLFGDAIKNYNCIPTYFLKK